MARSSTTFQKGGVGNPKGRPPEVKDVQALARQHTTLAVEALVNVAQFGDTDRARVAAAEALLNRGWGKPAQPVEASGSLVVTLSWSDDAQPRNQITIAASASEEDL